MTFLTKALAAPAVMAAASLVTVPAESAVPSTASHTPAEAVSRYGPYVGGGWGWGSGYRGHRRHRGSTAEDVLTGVLILGTIAAVANAANRAERRTYPQPYPYPDRREDYRRNGPQGLEGAADQCLREVERNARAREVTRIERSAGGWLVTGEMVDGSAFSCSIGADGRIDHVDVGGRAQSYGEADRQYDDERYRSARAEADAGPQPAYPGGPLPGDEEDDDAPES